MGFDVTANLIGAAIAVLLGAVMLCAAALSLSARFFRAVDRHPRRALDHLRAGKDTWLFVEEGDALDDFERLQGPYSLELPDGTAHTYFGRLEGMDGSMQRFLKQLPKS